MTALVTTDIGNLLPRKARLTLQDVPVGALLKSPGNLNPLNERRAESLAANWNQDLCEALTVSERDGRLFVVEGWHRVAAARVRGLRTLPARVLSGLSPADEARLFDQINTNRVKPSIGTRFWSRVEYGDQVATGVVETCHELGITVLPPSSGSASKHPRKTKAYKALLDAGAVSMLQLKHTLDTLITAWPADSHALDGACVQGVSGFLNAYKTHPTMSRPHLVEALSRVTASTYIARTEDAQRTLMGTVFTSSASSPFGRPAQRHVLLSLYNNKLRKNRLPELTRSHMRAMSVGRDPWGDER